MENKMLLTLGLTLLTTAGVFLGNTGSTTEIGAMNEFQQWKSVHNRFYTVAEEQYRFQIFAKNLAIVLEHNADKEQTFELAMNQFADLTNEEFSAQYLTLAPQAPQGIQSVQYAGDAAPESVEWTSKLNIKVKNQGSCGSCWAFSGIGALEAAHAQAGNNVYLSDQELVDCAHEQGFESDGCNGGWMNDVFTYSEQFGIAAESAYPYTGVGGKCDQTKTPRYKSKSHVLVESLNAKALLEAIAVTPVSVAINAGGIWFQLYSKGIFTRACAGGEDQLNHGVLATGYDNAQKFHNIKNSWGNTWGEAGYIRFGYVAAPEGQCGINQLPSYPVV